MIQDTIIVFSQDNRQDQEESEDLDQIEKNQTIEDLNKIDRQSQYRIEHSSEYAINKLEFKIPLNARRKNGVRGSC